MDFLFYMERKRKKLSLILYNTSGFAPRGLLGALEGGKEVKPPLLLIVVLKRKRKVGNFSWGDFS